MGTCMITFRSVTPAQRAEKLLGRAGLDCRLGRTPRRMEEQGCGYSITVRSADPEGLLRLLREHRIAYRRVYLRGEKGEWEDLAL